MGYPPVPFGFVAGRTRRIPNAAFSLTAELGVSGCIPIRGSGCPEHARVKAQVRSKPISQLSLIQQNASTEKSLSTGLLVPSLKTTRTSVGLSGASERAPIAGMSFAGVAEYAQPDTS